MLHSESSGWEVGLRTMLVRSNRFMLGKRGQRAALLLSTGRALAFGRGVQTCHAHCADQTSYVAPSNTLSFFRRCRQRVPSAGQPSGVPRRWWKLVHPVGLRHWPSLSFQYWSRSMAARQSCGEPSRRSHPLWTHYHITQGTSPIPAVQRMNVFAITFRCSSRNDSMAHSLPRESAPA